MKGKTKTKLLLVVVLVCCFVFLSNSASARQRADANIIYYQVDVNYPPFEFVKEGRPEGFDLELGRLIFNNSNYKVHYSFDAWDKVYERLRQGEIDTCGLLAVMDERKKDLLYTQPILKTYTSVYGKKDLTLSSLKSLKNYKIGVQKGDYGQIFLRDKLGLQEYYAYNNLEEGIAALEKGKIDVIFGNQEVINYFLVKHQLTAEIIPHLNNLFPIYLAYGINKDRPELVSFINQRLDELKKQGLYEAVYQKYFYHHSDYYNDQLEKRNLLVLVAILLSLFIGLVLMRLLIGKLNRIVKAATAKLEEEREWFRVTLSSIGDGVIATDVEGKVTFINPIAEKMTGFNAWEAIGKPVDQILQIFSEETGEIAQIPVEKVLKEKKIVGLANHTVLLSREGREQPIADSAAPIFNGNGEVIGVIMVFQDMLEKRIAEQVLEQNEIKYRSIFEGANDGILLQDKEIILDCNSKALAMFKAQREDLVGYPLDKVCPELQANGTPTIKAAMNKITKTLLGENQIFEWRFLTLNGTVFEAEVSTNLIQLNDRKLVQAIIRDISEKKRAEALIRYQAYYDELTNLPNRVLFYERLDDALRNAYKRKSKLAVFFIDLDSFKNINDTLGHHAGDLLLKQVASRLLETLGDEVTVSRMGGDEFALLITNIKEQEQPEQLAKLILEAFATPVSLDGYETFVSVSIGIAIYPEHGKNVHALLKNADAAMYKAKEMGRNSYQLYSLDLQEKALKRLNLEKQMREAIQNQEFINYYQPKVDLGKGEIIGWEALIRWQHPEKGLTLPGEFIPIAEEIGLISTLGEIVLRSACRQIREWIKAGDNPLPIAINLSAYQFRRPDLIERISGILEEMQVDPRYLELEITESVAIDNISHTTGTMKKLRGMGINIAIDDFGTGYSSLSYLRNFPVESLKVDRAFVQDILKDNNTSAIVKAIIEVAHSLGLMVTAEGVETREQLELLKAMGCDQIQGYLISKPISAGEINLVDKRGWGTILLRQQPNNE